MEKVINAFLGIRPSDVIEIIILYIIFYYIIILLKETRTMQMLKGLAVLFVASLVARVLELHAIDWILKNFWPIWVTAFLVLFQPELRQILVDIGQRRIKFRTLISGEEQVFDVIVDAVKQMHRKKMGGLLVLEREVGLKEYIDTG